VEQNTVTRL